MLEETLKKAYPELALDTPAAKARLNSILVRMGQAPILSRADELATLPMASTGYDGQLKEQPEVKALYARLSGWPLYEFAKWDVAELAQKPSALVVYDMGLGKTRLGLALAYALGGRVAVVVPSRLKPQWEKELQGLEEKPTVDIYTYEYVRMEEPPLKGYSAVIADEAHRLRNEATLTWEAMDRLSPPRRYALTATPTGGSMRQLTGVMRWLGISAYLPRLLQLYQDSRGIGLERARELRQELAPVVKVRTREDPEVLASIGQAYPVRLVTILLPPTPDYWQFYLLQVRNVRQWWLQNPTEARARRGLWRLLRASVDPQALGYAGRNAVLEAVAQAVRPGDLIFVDHKDIGARLANTLHAPFVHGGLPLGKRLKLVEAFRKGQHEALVATYGVLSEGYDIPEAGRVVVAEPTFDAVAMIQVAGRLQRPGRADPEVPVYRFAIEDTAAHYAILLADAKLATLAALKSATDYPGFVPEHGVLLHRFLARYA